MLHHAWQADMAGEPSFQQSRGNEYGKFMTTK